MRLVLGIVGVVVLAVLLVTGVLGAIGHLLLAIGNLIVALFGVGLRMLLAV